MGTRRNPLWDVHVPSPLSSLKYVINVPYGTKRWPWVNPSELPVLLWFEVYGRLAPDLRPAPEAQHHTNSQVLVHGACLAPARLWASADRLLKQLHQGHDWTKQKRAKSPPGQPSLLDLVCCTQAKWIREWPRRIEQESRKELFAAAF